MKLWPAKWPCDSQLRRTIESCLVHNRSGKALSNLLRPKEIKFTQHLWRSVHERELVLAGSRDESWLSRSAMLVGWLDSSLRPRERRFERDGSDHWIGNVMWLHSWSWSLITVFRLVRRDGGSRWRWWLIGFLRSDLSSANSHKWGVQSAGSRNYQIVISGYRIRNIRGSMGPGLGRRLVDRRVTKKFGWMLIWEHQRIWKEISYRTRCYWYGDITFSVRRSPTSYPENP